MLNIQYLNISVLCFFYIILSAPPTIFFPPKRDPHPSVNLKVQIRPCFSESNFSHQPISIFKKPVVVYFGYFI